MTLQQILIVCLLAVASVIIIGVIGILIDKHSEPED